MKPYHRVYAKISPDNIRHNIEVIKSRFEPDVKIMPVIKADGYGHGAVEVANVLSDIADCFAVATPEELIQLREAGIRKPIMILGTVPSGRYGEVIWHDAIIPVYTEQMAKDISEISRIIGKTATVHLALDTGMNRIGFPCDDEGLDIAKKIYDTPNLEVTGIFTHFATADSSDKTFSKCQKECFDEFCTKLEKAGYTLPMKHVCNSAAIVDMPQFHCNMVRPGIITYGFAPSEDVDIKKLGLRPAMELKSHLSFVKKVSKGEAISYGCTYVAPDDRVIATVPAGYADGYPRLLSNSGRVIVRGQYAPIVGRICMDQFMIDVTHIKKAEYGDEVTLMGKDGDCEVSATEIANLAQTINYEIICGIGKRVPRIYE